MKNFSDKIIKKIKKDKIKPKSKWVFLMKDYLIWSVSGVSVVIGGLAFLVILFILTSNDWDVYKYLDKGFIEYTLISLPYLWTVTLIAFLFIAYYNHRYSRKGYKYKAYLIVSLSVLSSLVIGGVLFFMGAGDKVEQIFSRNIPYYGGVMQHRMDMWSQPEKGLLAGRIISINKKGIIRVEDLRNVHWLVDIRNAHSKRSDVIQIDRRIKIIGEIKNGNNRFTAREIRPWVGRHNGMGRNQEYQHKR